MSRRTSAPAQPDEIPGKPFFKIGEAARLCAVKPYVLRYWESEFSVLRPGKTRSRHRLYRRKDVETLLEIRYLLYAERYTIEGAKRRLRDGTRAAGEKSARTEGATLAEVRQELLDLYRMLERDPAPPLKIE